MNIACVFFPQTFRTIEDLYEELVTQGIIIRPPPTRLSDYEGEYSYLGTTLRQANIEPMPSLSDVRRLVTEFGILPLGEAIIMEILYFKSDISIVSSFFLGKRRI